MQAQGSSVGELWGRQPEGSVGLPGCTEIWGGLSCWCVMPGRPLGELDSAQQPQTTQSPPIAQVQGLAAVRGAWPAPALPGEMPAVGPEARSLCWGLPGPAEGRRCPALGTAEQPPLLPHPPQLPSKLPGRRWAWHRAATQPSEGTALCSANLLRESRVLWAREKPLLSISNHCIPSVE